MWNPHISKGSYIGRTSIAKPLSRSIYWHIWSRNHKNNTCNICIAYIYYYIFSRFLSPKILECSCDGDRRSEEVGSLEERKLYVGLEASQVEDTTDGRRRRRQKSWETQEWPSDNELGWEGPGLTLGRGGGLGYPHLWSFIFILYISSSSRFSPL
jgi:hypothetical protein